MAPTLAGTPVLAVQSAANTTALSSGAVTVVDGDVIVVKVVSADATTTISTPSATGQTFTSRATSATANTCGAAIFTAVVTGSPGTITVSQGFAGGSNWHSMVVERWTGATLAATPATNTTKLGTGVGPSTTLTTTAASSVVTWCSGDWSANAPGTIAYRSGAAQDGLHDGSTTQYVAYYATQSAAAAGSQTIGMTTPAGSQTWTMLGIEVQDSGGGSPSVPPILVMATRR